MTFIPVSQTAEVVMNYRNEIDLNVMKNIIHVRHTETQWDAANLQLLTDAMATWWATDLRIAASQDVEMFSVYARSIHAASAEYAETVPDPPLDGNIATSCLPGNVAWAVKLLTGLTGRSYRGRSFFIGLAESSVSGNYIGQTTADAIVDAWVELKDVILPNLSAELVVVSRYTGGEPRVAGVATPVTTISYTDLVVDSQRRRLPGRGA